MFCVWKDYSSNIWGWWLRSDISPSILDEANRELERMKNDAPNAAAGMFSVDASGLNEIVRQ